MHYVYVLLSQKDRELYIGLTSDLRRRVKEHNEGKSFATGPRRPFKLIYYEAYESHDDAAHREQALKRRGQARVHLMTRLKNTLRQNQS